jgi:LCP family protein required for cell wall assembly
MSRNKILLLVAVAAGLLLLCACCSAVGYAIWNSPLGAPLALETVVAAPAPANLLNQTPIPLSVAIPTATLPSSAAPSNCGQSGSMNILVLGVDSPFLSGPKGPLEIRLIKIDFIRKSAVVFSFPRDLWLTITGLEAYGFTQARLGEAYLIARSNAGYSVEASTQLVAQNLYNHFGAKSGHYITVKIGTLAAMIDAVGGITVNIPAAYDGRPYGLHYFYAGTNSLTGMLALEYALAPSAPAQWSALDRKSLVLQALYQKIFSPQVIPNIPGLIPQFLQVATTDLSLQQIMDLICITQQIPRELITVTGVGPSDVTFGQGEVLYPKTDVIRAKVQQLIG